MSSPKVVLTYGTFDLFHIGHLRLLTRLRDLGDRLVVGVSSDEFNRMKGKDCYVPFEHRAEIVGALEVVDEVIREDTWEQKLTDIRRHDVAILGMGSDWTGRFDDFASECEVVYLPRTEAISSTDLREALLPLRASEVQKLKVALDVVGRLLDGLEA